MKIYIALCMRYHRCCIPCLANGCQKNLPKDFCHHYRSVNNSHIMHPSNSYRSSNVSYSDVIGLYNVLNVDRCHMCVCQCFLFRYFIFVLVFIQSIKSPEIQFQSHLPILVLVLVQSTKISEFQFQSRCPSVFIQILVQSE